MIRLHQPENEEGAPTMYLVEWVMVVPDNTWGLFQGNNSQI